MMNAMPPKFGDSLWTTFSFFSPIRGPLQPSWGPSTLLIMSDR